MTDSYVVSGYASEASYNRREPDWEGDSVRSSVDEAIAMAKEWLSGSGDDACAEVIRLQGQAAVVTHLATADGIERVDTT